VDDVRRHGDEAARRHADPLPSRAERERQLALEHVERVRVLAVNVRVGPALARRVARPGHRDLLAVGEKDDLPPLPLGDLLSVAA
jgi:hypothetical protein